MIYAVYVHKGDENHAHGVTIPDFPGCFSAADDWDDLPAMIQEAIESHCKGDAKDLPAPTPLDHLMEDPHYTDGAWLLVDIDTKKLDTKSVRLNISLPANLVARIDDHAKANHLSRSGFLAKAAEDSMAG